MRSIVNQAGSGVVIWGSCGFHLAGGATRSFQRDGVGVTSPLLRDSLATYTPGISERRGSATTFQHSGVKSTDARSNTSQAVAATRSYDAYGNVVSSSGSWTGPFGYGGGFGYQEVSATGLQLLGHRYYDSSTGRFLTRDPIKDGRNWYVYCDGDPVNGSDPEGLQCLFRWPFPNGDDAPLPRLYIPPRPNYDAIHFPPPLFGPGPGYGGSGGYGGLGGFGGSGGYGGYGGGSGFLPPYNPPYPDDGNPRTGKGRVGPFELPIDLDGKAGATIGIGGGFYIGGGVTVKGEKTSGFVILGGKGKF